MPDRTRAALAVDWTTVFRGAAIQVGLIVLSGLVRVPYAFWWLAVGLSLSIAAFGGFGAGIGAPTRRVGRLRGAASGLLGGMAFGAVLWYTMRTPGAPVGVFWTLNYRVATLPYPPGFAARYDAVIPIALAALATGVFVLVGTIAGGAIATHETSRT